MTPDTLEATAARYDRWYGTKPGDGGTSDQLRAGAQAMRDLEFIRELNRGLTREWNNLLVHGARQEDKWLERIKAAEAKLAALEEAR